MYDEVRAIRDMSAPTNVKELQTFFGLITYLQKFLPNLSEVSAPLRILLEKETAWHWDKEQKDSFEKLKELVTNTPVLAFYDKNADLILNVDASSEGLGAVLLQEGKPVAYASRALNNTQKRYAQIEKEALAIVFGCTKFHDLMFARHFVVESDHKPLEAIFKKPITQAPPRVQRFMLALQKYDFQVRHKPGKEMISDVLSRLYLHETKEDLVPDLSVNEIQLNSHLPMTPEKITELKESTERDMELQMLRDQVENGWPSLKSRVPAMIQKYWCMKDEITCIDGVLYKGYKVMIPVDMRKQMLNIIHENHLGIVKCKARAREYLFWPRMMTDIQETVEKCSVCALNDTKMNRREPMLASSIPDRPSAKMGADLFELKGQHYLLTVDYYSKWPEVEKLDNLATSNVIAYLKKQFARFGYVDELVTDNGPQFSSTEFKGFMKECGIVHTTTSPHYSQSNGQTERFVQTVKNLIKKSKDPSKALMDYRNTPLDGLNLSPAQLHIGRRLKSTLPSRAELLRPQTKTKAQELQKRQDSQRHYYNLHSGKPLRPLSDGETVTIRHNGRIVPGRVVHKHATPRSYIVETDEGRQLRRNRKHLKPTRVSFDEQPQFQPEPANEDMCSDVSENAMCASKQNVSENSANISLQNSGQSGPSEVISKPEMITRAGRSIKAPAKFDDYVCYPVEVFV